MSDWQVGDPALCVHGGWRDGPSHGPFPETNVLYTVSGARDFGPIFGLWLYVAGAPDNIDEDGTNWGPLWHSERFRKPDKHEACEDEFAILLKLSKQRVKA